MRATMHNGRAKSSGKVFGTKHNDRNFDTSKADNIDQDRMKDNVYLNLYNDPNMTFDEVELKFYEENFSHQLDQTNAKYKANGHPERCKSMEQWKAIRQNAPEETHLQIGKMEEHVTRKQLIACFNDYNKWLRNWNREHGNPFTSLNIALHCDEAVPHIQSRRVWHYQDEEGNLRIGQEKALKAAGIKLPDPSKNPGRRNNRKMVFDKMCREKWLDICHEHGIEVDRDPVPDARHNMEKEEMIRHKYETMLQETSKLEAKANALESEISAKAKTLDSLDDSINAKYKELQALADILPESYPSEEEVERNSSNQKFGHRIVKEEDYKTMLHNTRMNKRGGNTKSAMYGHINSFRKEVKAYANTTSGQELNTFKRRLERSPALRQENARLAQLEQMEAAIEERGRYTEQEVFDKYYQTCKSYGLEPNTHINELQRLRKYDDDERVRKQHRALDHKHIHKRNRGYDLDK